MNTQTRRQREFMQREQLFLSTARNIIREQGFHALTMEKIAAETEYAKGTIYKHFANKEDLTLSLCAEGLAYLVRLCEEMHNFSGAPREKLAIVVAAYQAYSSKYPEEQDLIMEARAGNLREKATPERLQAADENDSKLMLLLRGQIDAAIEQGHLTLPPLMKKDDICFGLWALSFGISVLHQANDLLVNMDIDLNGDMLSKQLSIMLDGYQWRPLSTEFNYQETLIKAQQHIEQTVKKLG